MIESYEVRTIMARLHKKSEYVWTKENFPEMSDEELWYEAETAIDIEDIYRMERGENDMAVIWVPRDDQGGGKQIQLLDNYDELYNFLISHSKRLKNILGYSDRGDAPNIQ